MNLDLSVLMPLLAIVVSLGAALFWNGQGGKGVKAEEYLYTKVRQTVSSSPKLDVPKASVRVEVLPGARLRSSDLRARDKTEDVVSA